MPATRKLLFLVSAASLGLSSVQSATAGPEHRTGKSPASGSPSETSTPAPSSSQPSDTAPCTPVALSETIGAGFNAWELKNEPAWDSARVDLPAILACQRQPLSVELSARTLQFQGLAAGGANQPELMRSYLRGAAAISREYPFTAAMFPRDHYYALAWEEAAAVAVPAPVALLSPDGLTLDRRITTYVNGARTREIIPEVTSLVQVEVSPRGMLMTVPLTPSADEPRLPPVPSLQDALDEQARALQTRRRLWLMSGGAAVAALACEAAAQSLQASSGTDTPDRRAFVLNSVAIGVVGASGGLFAAGWSVGR